MLPHRTGGDLNIIAGQMLVVVAIEPVHQVVQRGDGWLCEGI